MKLAAHAQTHPGNVRPKNEDSHLIDMELGLYVVCDGVGGNVGGKLASETAAQTIQKHIKANRAVVQKYLSDRNPKTRALISQMVQQAILAASQAIFAMAEIDPAKKGMATTVEVVLFAGDYAILGHVGDSRIYLYRSDKTYLLTEDHSVPAEMVRQGVWTVEEALKSPYAHTLTRAVGPQAFVQVDTLEVELAVGDTFLLCSDGLCNYFVKGPEYGQIARQTTVEKLPEALVQFALQQGGRDNVTVLIVKVEATTAPTAQQGAQAIDAGKKTELLRQIPLFRYLNPREINRVLSLSTSQAFPKDSPIIQEGLAGTQIFIIVSGSVMINKGGQTLTSRAAGEILGEMALLDNAPRSASVVTSEPTTCLVISQKDLFDLLRKEAQLAVKLLWALSQSLNQTLRSTTSQLASLKADLETLKDDGPFLDTRQS